VNQILPAVFTALLLLAGCNSRVQKTSGQEGLPIELNASALNYASLERALFAPHCLECHAQYASYEGVRRELSAIGDAVSSGQMPKGSLLSAELKASLAAWIAAGAPLEVNAPSTPPPTLSPTFASLNAEVFTPLCVSCHGPNGQAKFLDLSSQEAILAARSRMFANGKKLFDSANPDASYILEVVNDNEEPMPPPYSNLRRLSVEEVGALREWISRDLP
jgi:mono/diheme cytochrome c family protein